MNSIATLGMFNDIRGGGVTRGGGGAIMKQEAYKPSIRVNSIKIDNKSEQKTKGFISIKYVEN